MTKTRKDQPGVSIGMMLDEALQKRLLQTKFNGLQDSITQTVHDEEGAREYVEERKDSIRKGARRAPKRFRL